MCEHDNEGIISYGTNKWGDTIKFLNCTECGQRWDYYPQYSGDGLE